MQCNNIWLACSQEPRLQIGNISLYSKSVSGPFMKPLHIDTLILHVLDPHNFFLSFVSGCFNYICYWQSYRHFTHYNGINVQWGYILGFVAKTLIHCTLWKETRQTGKGDDKSCQLLWLYSSKRTRWLLLPPLKRDVQWTVAPEIACSGDVCVSIPFDCSIRKGVPRHRCR